MRAIFLTVCLIATCLPTILGHQQVLLPTGQTVVSSGQFIQPQSPIIQLLRQPSGSLAQVFGNSALQQLLSPQVTTLNALAQQQLTGADLLPYLTALNGLGGLTNTGALGLGGLNGLPYGITGLPYGNGLTTANINGVPVIVSGLNNGLLQQSFALPSTSSVPLIQSVNGITQPVVNLGPVIRQAPEGDDDSSGLIQLDPMDVALLDKEKKGQMHMEKYAWGRNLQSAPATTRSREDGRADIPRYYSAVPTGFINTGLGNVINQNGYALPTVTTPTRSVNPFLGIGGKRKKHFEHYEYF